MARRKKETAAAESANKAKTIVDKKSKKREKLLQNSVLFQSVSQLLDADVDYPDEIDANGILQDISEVSGVDFFTHSPQHSASFVSDNNNNNNQWSNQSAASLAEFQPDWFNEQGASPRQVFQVKRQQMAKSKVVKEMIVRKHQMQPHTPWGRMMDTNGCISEDVSFAPSFQERFDDSSSESSGDEENNNTTGATNDKQEIDDDEKSLEKEELFQETSFQMSSDMDFNPTKEEMESSKVESSKSVIPKNSQESMLFPDPRQDDSGPIHISPESSQAIESGKLNQSRKSQTTDGGDSADQFGFILTSRHDDLVGNSSNKPNRSRSNFENSWNSYKSNHGETTTIDAANNNNNKSHTGAFPTFPPTTPNPTNTSTIRPTPTGTALPSPALRKELRYSSSPLLETQSSSNLMNALSTPAAARVATRSPPERLHSSESLAYNHSSFNETPKRDSEDPYRTSGHSNATSSTRGSENPRPPRRNRSICSRARPSRNNTGDITACSNQSKDTAETTSTSQSSMAANSRGSVTIGLVSDHEMAAPAIHMKQKRRSSMGNPTRRNSLCGTRSQRPPLQGRMNSVSALDTSGITRDDLPEVSKDEELGDYVKLMLLSESLVQQQIAGANVSNFEKAKTMREIKSLMSKTDSFSKLPGSDSLPDPSHNPIKKRLERSRSRRRGSGDSTSRRSSVERKHRNSSDQTKDSESKRKQSRRQGRSRLSREKSSSFDRSHRSSPKPEHRTRKRSVRRRPSSRGRNHRRSSVERGSRKSSVERDDKDVSVIG